MQKTIFDIYTKEEIEKILSHIDNLLEKKLKDEEILSKINFELKEELLSIARAREKNQELKTKNINAKYFNEHDLRFSTPLIIAEYRAKRLKCNKIVDLCSGIGIQANAFAKFSKEVIGVEISRKKVMYSVNNFSKENLNFLSGDVLSNEIITKIKEFNPDIIFCDPERLSKEKERNLNTIKPQIKELIKKYSLICKNICIELPPQINHEELNKLKIFGDFEIEYLSLNNQLNRLNLYFNGLKKSEISVVDVDSKTRIENKKKSNKNNKKTERIMNYLFEASTAIKKAKLEEELAELTDSFVLENKKKLILTSDSLIKNQYKNFIKSYKVLGVCKDKIEVKNLIKKLNIGKIILKTNIEPKDYWKERKFFENGLKGKNIAVLFFITEKYVVVREIM